MPQKSTDSNIKPKFTHLLVELFLIVTAVFLGLFVNEVRLAQSKKARTNKVLDYLIVELEANSSQLEKIIPYHKSIRDSLNQLNQLIFTRKISNPTYEDLIKAMPQGFRVPLLESTGWQLLNNSGSVNEIELELAVKLSKIYNRQVFLDAKLERVGDNMYISSNNNIDELDNLFVSFGFLLPDILMQEERLQIQYPEVIQAIRDRSK